MSTVERLTLDRLHGRNRALACIQMAFVIDIRSDQRLLGIGRARFFMLGQSPLHVLRQLAALKVGVLDPQRRATREFKLIS
jgi:hypothetical protein